jgi:hypothetical protein
MTENHQLAGRIAGATGIASFCTCGNAYYGQNVIEADQLLGKHRNDTQKEEMTIRTCRQRTIIQTFGPDETYTTITTLDGVSLVMDSMMPLTIDGNRYRLAGKRSVEITTAMITTTITVIPE